MHDTGAAACAQADVLLMSIETLIPDHFQVYQVGFDASPSAVPKQAVGIHQPDGSYKSISTAASVSTSFPKPNFPPTEVQPTEQTHFQVHSLHRHQGAWERAARSHLRGSRASRAVHRSTVGGAGWRVHGAQQQVTI